jgi:hypothetical protein
MSAKEKADAAAAAGGDGEGDGGAATSSGSQGPGAAAEGTMSGPQPDDPAAAAAAASAAPGTAAEADDLPRLPQLAPKTTLPAVASLAAPAPQVGLRSSARGRQPGAGGQETEALSGGAANSQQLPQASAQMTGLCAAAQPPQQGRRQQLQRAAKA